MPTYNRVRSPDDLCFFDFLHLPPPTCQIGAYTSSPSRENSQLQPPFPLFTLSPSTVSTSTLTRISVVISICSCSLTLLFYFILFPHLNAVRRSRSESGELELPLPLHRQNEDEAIEKIKEPIVHSTDSYRGFRIYRHVS